MSIRSLIKELQPTHGNTAAANRGAPARRLPGLQDLLDAKPVSADVYNLTEQEIKTVRSRVYALNKDNAFGWRWRTLVEPSRGRFHQLLVWRIH